MKNNRTKFLASMIFEVINMINQKTYDAKIRRYKRMIDRDKAIKDRISEIVSMASATFVIIESFSSTNEEQCAGANASQQKN